MADINSDMPKSPIAKPDDPDPAASVAPMIHTPASAQGSEAQQTSQLKPSPNATSEQMRLVELLFFAYRDFTGDADVLLAQIGYGRAHHRVIHFVARHPRLRVADLLQILRITKQSLAPILKQLIDEGLVTQESGKTDRRERHLLLTSKGEELANKLSTLQCARVDHALKYVSGEDARHVEEFLIRMISDREHAAVAALIDAARNDK